MKQNSGGIYMKRVYLFCNAGMSTSLVASKMQEVANQHQLPIEVKAFSKKHKHL